MSETKDTRWIDFSKIPVDTLVEIKCHYGADFGTMYFKRVSPDNIIAPYHCSQVSTKAFNGKSEEWMICGVYHKIRISSKNPWLPWFGGDCPVPENCMVETILRTKRKLKDEAWIVDWLHFEKSVEDNEVIAYRLLESPWQTIDGVCDE